MNPIHDSNGNLLAIEMNGSRISAAALSRMAASVDRYRVGLEAISRALVNDPYAFAQAIVDGKAVQEALEMDALNLDAEPSPEIDAGLLRIDARRELVKAALRLFEAEQQAGSYPTTAYRPWQQAETALYAACATFLAAGGSEVEG